MSKRRVEAFSDGVLAIIITIMVLEMKIPQGSDWTSLKTVLPVFISYALSFLNIAIYWNNHHHMLQSVHHINGKVMWANTHLLFWLSLVPFVTGWMGENHFAMLPVATYGIVLLMAGLSYFILSRVLISLEGKDSVLARVISNNWKGLSSFCFLTAGIISSFFNPWFGFCLYFVVAAIWFIPDRQIEIKFEENKGE